MLCELRDSRDPETGSRFTIKVYRSEKRADGAGSWTHSRITLSPDSTDTSFEALVLDAAEGKRLSVLGRLVEVLGFPEG